jgi:hypothetical protein
MQNEGSFALRYGVARLLFDPSPVSLLLHRAPAHQLGIHAQ